MAAFFHTEAKINWSSQVSQVMLSLNVSASHHGSDESFAMGDEHACTAVVSASLAQTTEALTNIVKPHKLRQGRRAREE